MKANSKMLWSDHRRI